MHLCTSISDLKILFIIKEFIRSFIHDGLHYFSTSIISQLMVILSSFHHLSPKSVFQHVLRNLKTKRSSKQSLHYHGLNFEQSVKSNYSSNCLRVKYGKGCYSSLAVHKVLEYGIFITVAIYFSL